MPSSSAMVSRKGLGAVVVAAERDLRHRGAQHAGGDRVTLGVVGIQKAFRRRPVDHLRQLQPTFTASCRCVRNVSACSTNRQQ